jgi:hypothetical protein
VLPPEKLVAPVVPAPEAGLNPLNPGKLANPSGERPIIAATLSSVSSPSPRGVLPTLPPPPMPAATDAAEVDIPPTEDREAGPGFTTPSPRRVKVRADLSISPYRICWNELYPASCGGDELRMLSNAWASQ